MRIGIFVFALISMLGLCGCGHTNAGTKASSNSSVCESCSSKILAPANSSTAPAAADPSGNSNTNAGKISAKVDFPTRIRPILEARCQPCHFNGGKVYQRMPFDRAETIKTLGTKLFTRIKDESERRLIRDFLAQE